MRLARRLAQRNWLPRVMGGLTLVVLAWVYAAVAFAAAPGDPSVEPGVQTHGMVLLLPQGPLHIQIDITDDGRPLQAIRDAYLRQLVKTLDVDADGKVGRNETTKHPLFVSGRRFTGNKFLESLRASKAYSPKELKLAVDRAAGQLVAIRQDNSLVDQDLSVLRVLDEDESGLIERREMRSAASRIAARDSDFDKCITFDEFLDTPPVDPLAPAPIEDAAPPSSIHSNLLRNADEPILAPRLVRHYDVDRDAHLSREELNWSRDRFSELDRNSDQLLNVQELSNLPRTQPDLRLKVDLNVDATVSKPLELVSVRSELDLDTSRENVVNFHCESISMSIGYRQRDPLQEAETNALTTFNLIDVDANGYLDREEIAERQRFQRYLFAAMDVDEDDRVFAEELLNYVRAYTEPATTSCRVSLFDMGSGHFQMLDKNSDGRISIRELRGSEQSLLAVSEQGTINPSRLPKSYRIEIVRGGVGLFGRVDRPQAGDPEALLLDPIGPIWFQRMDRNSDGDLTWDEFLGPREIFHQLDQDGDDLIDPQEAKRAAQ